MHSKVFAYSIKLYQVENLVYHTYSKLIVDEIEQYLNNKYMLKCICLQYTLELPLSNAIDSYIKIFILFILSSPCILLFQRREDFIGVLPIFSQMSHFFTGWKFRGDDNFFLNISKFSHRCSWPLALAFHRVLLGEVEEEIACASTDVLYYRIQPQDSELQRDLSLP